MTKCLTFIFSFMLACALFADTTAVDTSIVDTSIVDTSIKADSITFTLGAGVVAEIIIPSSPLFSALRGDGENAVEKSKMTQDAEERFSSNDVTVSAGFALLYRKFAGWQFTGTASWFGFENGNGWSPNKSADSTITADRVNRYRLDCIRIGLCVQKTLPADFITADGYARLYIAAGLDGYPLMRLSTDRTALGGKRVSYAKAAGYRVGLGAEKRISEKTLLLGEIMYGNTFYGSFESDGVVLQKKNLLRNGDDSEVQPELKSVIFELKIVRGLF
ncbi:MAG: hypothetical protein JNL74_06880 [Fibrobacteres bacterium]|nr:hypothetical protein [Fibrobacterota bacterium]